MSDIESWLMLPEVWLILGILLVIAELLLGAEYFLLAIGVSAMVTSGVIFGQEQDWYRFIEDWRDIAFLFAGLAILAVVLLRVVFRQKEPKTDINKY